MATTPRRFFEHPGFAFETQIALGAAAHSCAEAGEVLATAERVGAAAARAEAARQRLCEPVAPTLRNQRVFDWLEPRLGR